MGQPLKLSDKNKPWAKDLQARKQGKKPQRRYFLIVCEGEKTEPNYFNGLKKELPKNTVNIVVKGEGRKTLKLVDYASELKRKQQDHGQVDKVWVVFDRDSFPPCDFDNAIKKAATLGFGAAWSNEAFELWYLLHFEDRKTGMNRTEYKTKLTQHLGRPYRKNDKEMYASLREKFSEAYQRAKKLDIYHQQAQSIPHKSNPCTQVHELVNALRALSSQNIKTKKVRT